MKIENSSVATRVVTLESQQELKDAIRDAMIARGHVTDQNVDTVDIEFIYDTPELEDCVITGAVVRITHVTPTTQENT